MRDDGIATTAMLRLPWFQVLAVSEYAGELEEAVQTTAAEEFCRGCGVRGAAIRPASELGAGPTSGRPVTLVWVRRVWRCGEPRCATRMWTERSEQIRPRTLGRRRRLDRRSDRSLVAKPRLQPQLTTCPPTVT